MENIEEILNKYELKQGKHASLEQGACIMELVSYIAHEPWTDRPKCACPVLTSFAIRYNDRVDDKERQRLKPLIPKLLNSRDKTKELLRAQFFALRAVTVFLPELTDALDLTEISAKLRSFTAGDFLVARDYINKQRPIIREAMRKHAAADAAAADAAAAAAYAAYAYASRRPEIIRESLAALEAALEVGE